MKKVANKMELYNTQDLQSIFNHSDKTLKHKLMNGLLADTSMGKRTSFKAYARRDNVFMVTVEDNECKASLSEYR